MLGNKMVNIGQFKGWSQKHTATTWGMVKTSPQKKVLILH